MSHPLGLTPFASARFSPVRFDPAEVSERDVDLLVEAARLAPSAGNSQPWSFVVGRRGDVVHRRLVGHLARSSSRWAAGAGVLIANLSHRFVEGTAMEYSEFAHYDLGQAVAHMTFQAHALGLEVHQFRAFDRQGVAGEFDIPTHWEVTSMSAIGVPLGSARDHVSPGTSRERRVRSEIVWASA